MVKSRSYSRGNAPVANGAIMQALSARYILLDEPRVQRFLEEAEYLLPLLNEVPTRIMKCFPNAPITLQVVEDPEGGADDYLVAHIGTTLLPEAALASLKRFDDDWWLRMVDQARGKLVINLDFV